MLERKPQPNETDGWAETHTDRSIYHEIRQRAYTMRQNPTPAEDALWAQLRRRQIGAFHFRRQHPIDRFIVDFYCAKARLVIEVDGNVHDQPGYDEHDSQRQAHLESLGLRVLRFTNDDVMTELPRVLEIIAESLRP